MAVTEQAAAIERARKGYTAFDAGDVQTVIDLIADDVKWHVGGTSKFAGDYEGKQKVLEFFGRLMAEGFVQKHAIHDILANDQHVVVLCDVSVTYNGKTDSGQVVDVYHENDQGQLKEFWRIAADQARLDALIGS
jgi:ketosteroid isomerase-like protein